jgi:hypothetical protein
MLLCFFLDWDLVFMILLSYKKTFLPLHANTHIFMVVVLKAQGCFLRVPRSKFDKTKAKKKIQNKTTKTMHNSKLSINTRMTEKFIMSQ